MKHCIVAGGGFRGIISALVLARRGLRVTLVEAAPLLGGVLASKHWNGFDLDLGCHLFDNSSDAETDLILEILGEEHSPVRVRYAAKFQGHKSEGLAVVPFAGCDRAVRDRLLREVLEAASMEHPAPDSLAQLFEQRYGLTAAGLLAVATRKAYRAHPAELDPASIDMTVLGRIALGEDSLARTLKHIPRLDAILAARSDHDPLLFHRERVQRRDFRNFYPTRHGMRGFCERARALLQASGVELLLGHDITGFERAPGRVQVDVRARGSTAARRLDGDSLQWCLGIERLASLAGHGEHLAQQICGVPMVLYYFTIPESAACDYSYVHDFDADTLTFRASCPGNFATGNRPMGMSYLCCEVPTERDSEVWNAPESCAERVWDEARALGLTDARAATAVHTIKAPVSYRVLRRGYSAAAASFARTLQGQDEILFSVSQDMTKTRIYEAVLGTLAA